MSGTSMDGVDFAYVNFSKSADEKWKYEILASDSYDYPRQFLEELAIATQKTAEELLYLDKQLGNLYGTMANQFIDDQKINRSEITAIASHGHTIFHQPNRGFTYQIGCGASIARLTKVQVINDFRTKDVIHGGQGAPLVPIGDLHLFSQHADAMLNIGGFANICFPGSPTIAFDISPGNLPLNKIVSEYFDQAYDRGGKIASEGQIIPKLLEQLNQLSFYTESAPKSLGTEWLDAFFYPILDKFRTIRPEDLLRTIVEHEAIQISKVIDNTISSVMITGGGAKNDFLIERIQHHSPTQVIIPEEQLIDFKEALIFAFLGTLYLEGEPNTISSVTGAQTDVCSGVLHQP